MQLDLFAWGQPAPQRRPALVTGFQKHHPCACGSTHTLTHLDHPYSPLTSLRHWRISTISPHTKAMMADRHASTDIRTTHNG